MSNNYESKVRTYLARNLIWNASASSPDLYTLSPPNDLDIASSDTVIQMFRLNWPIGKEYRIQGNANIKRIGVFSNFADGLVMNNIKDRLYLWITGAQMSISKQPGTVDFTEGSNIITGTNLNAAYPGAGFQGFIMDDSFIQGSLANHSYPYAIYDVALAGTSARISDYAYRTISNTSIHQLVYSNVQTYTPIQIPALNTMFDAEAFIQSFIAAGPVAENMMFYATLGFNSPESGSDFTFYTKSIDTSFDTIPVSFDAVAEIEITD
jgi:hypothetical protein